MHTSGFIVVGQRVHSVEHFLRRKECPVILGHTFGHVASDLIANNNREQQRTFREKSALPLTLNIDQGRREVKFSLFQAPEVLELFDLSKTRPLARDVHAAGNAQTLRR